MAVATGYRPDLKHKKTLCNEEVGGRSRPHWITDNILRATILSEKRRPHRSNMITEPLVIILVYNIIV